MQREVRIIKQEDGAELHHDKSYKNETQNLFGAFYWLIFNLPSQFPITNVHTACIFPTISKVVSTDQAMVNGSRLLRGDHFIIW